jgi:hypothetical protein
MSSINITDLDWNLLETKYNVSLTNIIEVQNIFKPDCNIFIPSDCLHLWNNYLHNNNNNSKKINIAYEFTETHKWIMFYY